MQLGIESNKKQLSTSKQIFLVNRQQNTIFQESSQEFSSLTKQNKMQQIDTLYDQYNLFKYSKLMTVDSTARPKNLSVGNNRNQQNSEIMKFKNGQEARKQSTELKLRLGELKDGRKGIINQIKKYVINDKR